MKKRIKFLHLMPDSVYTVDYTKKVDKLFNSDEHLFIVYSYNRQQHRSYNLSNIVVCEKVNLCMFLKIVIWSLRATAVLFQGLYLDKKLLLMYAVFSLLARGRCSWTVWGSDLICEHEEEYKIHGVMLKKRMKRACRRIIIGNLKNIIASPDDYEYVVRNYKTSAKRIQGIYSYSLPDFDPYTDDCFEKKEINVLAGHSGSAANCHKELYDILTKMNYKGNVYSVLSYDGNEEYVRKIQKYGIERFGEKYFPVFEWMTQSQYSKFLRNMDIAIFLADRQAAIGNIILLLYQGVKIFSYDYGIIPLLKKEGAIIYHIDDLNSQSLSLRLTNEDIIINRKVAKKVCSNDYFEDIWTGIFTECIGR